MIRRTATRRRPVALHVDDIVRVGRELGMSRLSVSAVAAELGVSAPALYRHIEGRWELERLVGESLLADLQLLDDPADDLPTHLLSFALQLRAFTLQWPGLAAYLQALFPRGESGRQLLTSEVQMLVARGYSRAAAITMSGAVASLTIGFIVAEERPTAAGDPEGYEREVGRVVTGLLQDPFLGPAHTELPVVSPEDYTRALLKAAISGLVTTFPPGSSVPTVLNELLDSPRSEVE